MCGEAEGELVAATLVFEAVDATEGLSYGDVEEEVGEGEEEDWCPAMAAVKTARGLGEREEDDGEEDEEELKKLVELLLLVVNGSFFLKGFLEMELDYGV